MKTRTKKLIVRNLENWDRVHTKGYVEKKFSKLGNIVLTVNWVSPSTTLEPFEGFIFHVPQCDFSRKELRENLKQAWIDWEVSKSETIKSK